MGDGLKRARKATRDTRAAEVPDADNDVCECGHYAHEHVDDRCTVCTCNMWCWKLSASPVAPAKRCALLTRTQRKG